MGIVYHTGTVNSSRSFGRPVERAGIRRKGPSVREYDAGVDQPAGWVEKRPKNGDIREKERV